MAMDPNVTAAIITFGSVVFAFIGRDVIMSRYHAYRHRQHEIRDRVESKSQSRRELVKRYADPLLEATRSLKFRLNEIIDKAPERYFLADIPKTEFSEYKRLSTLYRLAALLGWIRAFRREVSYLDPEDRE